MVNGNTGLGTDELFILREVLDETSEGLYRPQSSMLRVLPDSSEATCTPAFLGFV